MARLKKRLLIGLGVVAVLLIGALGAGYAILKYAAMPLEDGAELAGGAVTTVVTDYIGPIAIGAYVLELADGGVALVDAGLDPEATAIRAALARMGRSPHDVRAVFFTHEHDDHMAGARAFGEAAIYAHHSYASGITGSANEVGAPATMKRRIEGVEDGDQLEIYGTRVEIFGLPGHTPGSIAILAHGVLFLGDSAASLPDGRLYPNTLLADDAEQNVRSLRKLAERHQSRESAIRHLAFGHHGPLDGIEPLLEWASASGSD